MARKMPQAYTEEFRREAVNRPQKEGCTTASVARGLGVGRRAQRREAMEEPIKDTYEAFEATYGVPRLAKELNELGHPCSVNYVAQIMS